MYFVIVWGIIKVFFNLMTNIQLDYFGGGTAPKVAVLRPEKNSLYIRHGIKESYTIIIVNQNETS